ncbi:hypothetical protein A2803_05050 [Candidatus Woesebacteria bacterium RIFCSPHIGHO2_01_FULL_44_21]|uniref:Uncharacterized protein n=1 Tax=Candidatus Woesebacteria bacterium RIFCSPHIGHO2_01_FULL_44_21 TaxID=1802503 RepID=A0A1F7Z015_9BACT|nr:MAG: hypothetical protein A2803_05050 [Candidatus Woesebacteria bacterium RIFCSPHIGHO2_01_FULL_44_21]OGM68897.1 MAG: hypothetical protein A2897_01925 [Candidatus Woesebacteria bacterium RIFCSPLOWO2_01_FULL_44_24b]
MEKLTGTLLKIPEIVKSALKSKKAVTQPRLSQVEPQQTVQAKLGVQAQPVVQVATAPPPRKLPGIKIPRKIIIAVAALVVILIILMIAMKLFGGKGTGVFPIASPSPSPRPTPEVEVPSQYADDEDVRKIQENMEALDKELNEAEFRDDRLRIPTLDWEVEFEK